MVSAIHPAMRPHPEASRIAGLAAAITFNAALLMLLLVPITAPPPIAVQETIPVSWTLPTKQPKPKPPVPLPVTVPIIRPQPHALADPQPPTRVTATPSDEVVVDHGTLPVTTISEVVASNIQPESTGPLPGVRLEYAEAPAPSYPRDALREAVEGIVLLQVLVDVDGRPLQVDVQRGSGDRRLDNAARRQVLQHWRFRPAMKDGRPVQAIGPVPIAFDLHG